MHRRVLLRLSQQLLQLVYTSREVATLLRRGLPIALRRSAAWSTLLLRRHLLLLGRHLLLGLTGDTFATHAAPLSLRGLVAGLMPDIQHFWMCDALANNGRIAWSYVASALSYAATSCTLFLTAGCLAFKERDLG